MAFYENVFIARQDVTAQQVESLADLFAGIIAAQGGQVTKREYWGLKGLTFRIKKNRKGHYMLMNIDAPAAAVIEMERNMRLHEDVLRELTVRVDELEAGPSAMIQSKGRDREGREGREGGREGRDREFRRDRDDFKRDDRLRPSRASVAPESDGGKE
jgi:small subunit ribosomal protein S6